MATRVVLEVAPGATYHVERAGTDGRDLAVIFEPARTSSMVMVGPPIAGAPAEPEPDIPMAQAIANAASITPGGIPPSPTPIATAAPVAAPRPQVSASGSYTRLANSSSRVA